MTRWSSVSLVAFLSGVLSAGAGPAANVAVVEAESKELTAPLQSLLQREGFDVTVVPWDEFSHGRVPAREIDLVVLADARRLPTAAVETTVSLLRSRGKVIAIGAPAFGEILIRTPSGYLTEEQYGEAVYDALSKRPILFSATGWRRACRNPRRDASIQPESDQHRAASDAPDAGGAGTVRAWKVTTDLESWDSFSQPIENAFREGHTLLCFEARGDADTPQLSIECNERDHSRWIATVELSREWQKYVLRPTDFGHWFDSPAKRGGPGDRFNPANVAAIQLGLSDSHTPQCEPGTHTFWFRDVSTAAAPDLEEPDLKVPDVDGLCPSYMLYPLVETASLRPAHCLAESALRALMSPPSPEADPALIGRDPRDPIAFAAEGYSAVWREQGIGFDRGRGCRWVRALDAYDAGKRNRGALVWLMLGETLFPGAIWANVGLADPSLVFSDAPEAIVLRKMVGALAKAMTEGCFLLEAGSGHFSYRPGETVELGALVMNSGRRYAHCSVTFDVTDPGGKHVFATTDWVTVPPGERGEVTCDWTPRREDISRFPCTVTTYLFRHPPPDEMDEQLGGRYEDPIDSISHRIDPLPTEAPRPEEFVRVEGSHFVLGGKRWHMLGINYRPASQGGRPTLSMFERALYDPVVIERDLTWLESMGINTLSAIFAPVPPDPDAPGAYRDLHDFLERCRRHGIKVFYFLPWGNPLPKANVDAIKRHIEAAGIKDHPAILAWELAWEPIHHLGSRERSLEFLTADWNAWIVERYGSLASAERDWGFQLNRASTADAELVAVPEQRWCVRHGPWDRVVAAFRRFFSDRVGQAYGEVVRELRRFDPNHLVTFRFGACGIPDQARFAHAHSAGVAKHVDFLCPEGYNLQTRGWAKPTPADDIRKGGLVTLYYRFLSREKPVVWMEFGYTVNGFHQEWKTGREHVSPDELAHQRDEYESFYRMFLESGARGAAPWWFPGGFRLGELSDFGVLEPDGTERPACEVLRHYLPKFAEVPHGSCVAYPEDGRRESRPVITLDLDAHYADAWEFYSPQYLEAVKSGRLPHLRTEGTGSTSADCPLVAVGNTPANGHNPPTFLNAEFNAIEAQPSDGDSWRGVRPGDVLPVGRGVQPRFRVSVGNIAEATWVASESDRADEPGAVVLRCTFHPSSETIDVPIAAHTPYLQDAQVGPFRLPLLAHPQTTITFQMATTRRQEEETQLVIPFGQKRSVTIELVP